MAFIRIHLCILQLTSQGKGKMNERYNRYNRAKRLLNVMNKRYPVIVTKIEQNVSLKVITDNLKYSLD